MKVMGYKNKEVSSIVLNIYTPFVIIAYLLSIPAMKSILNKIVSSLVADTEMTIPITLSFKTAMIGLLGLLLAYYIAISISKRVLKKVPLAVALKRE
jgi:putative ABC transport system permease protein